MKKTVIISMIVLLVSAVGFFMWIWVQPGTSREILDFVPRDAIYVLRSDEPVDDWKELSSSGSWQYLRKMPFFEEVNENATFLDSLIEEHSSLSQLAGKREMLISAHMISANDYDYLILIDLKKGAKITFLKDFVTDALRKSNYKIKERKLENADILEIYDDEGETYLFSFVDNILLVSSSGKILINALRDHTEPFFIAHESFETLFKDVSHAGPYQIFFNADYLDELIALYSTELTESSKDLLSIFKYSGHDFDMGDDKISLKGLTLSNDSVPSLLNSMRGLKGHKLLSDEILPSSTAMMFKMGFDDFDEFFEKFEANLKNSPELYAEFVDGRKKTENLLKIDFQDHLLSWIGNEVSMSLIHRVDSQKTSGVAYAYLAAFHTKDIESAKEKLEFVEKKIKKRTPVKFKEVDYNEHSIHYLEMKGFFKLFFGKMFKKFDKPFFTYIDDFVVFSTDINVLFQLIDDNEARTTLAENEYFEDFIDEFNRSSNAFIYINPPLISNFLYELADGSTKAQIRASEELLARFPKAGFQFRQDPPYFETHLSLKFE